MRFRPAALLYFAQRLFCAKGDSSPSASGYLSSHIKGPRPKFPRISSPQMEPERLSDEQHGFCGERNHCPGRMGNRWSGKLGEPQGPGTPSARFPRQGMEQAASIHALPATRRAKYCLLGPRGQAGRKAGLRPTRCTTVQENLLEKESSFREHRHGALRLRSRGRRRVFYHLPSPFARHDAFDPLLPNWHSPHSARRRPSIFYPKRRLTSDGSK